MAGGLYVPIRPQTSPQSTSFTSKLILLLTLLPLSLATFAFLLQWRGGAVNDPITRWSPEQSHLFPGMDVTSPLPTLGHSASSDCSLLARGGTSGATFPYFRDWKFDFSADLKPKVRFNTYICVFVQVCACISFVDDLICLLT